MIQDISYRIQKIVHHASTIIYKRLLTCCLLSLFLLLSVCFSLSSAYAQVAGKITSVQGRVDILRKGAEAAVTLNLGDAVSIGDVVRTKSDGKVEITFVDNSVMSVGPKSRLGIDEYLFKPDEGKRTVELKLYRGKTGFKVPKPVYPAEGSKFEMKTKTAVAGVRGTIGILYSDGVERVFVKEGIVEFYNPYGSVVVSQGEVGEVMHGRSPVERPYSDKEMKKNEDEVAPKTAPKKTEGTATTTTSAGGTSTTPPSPPPPPPVTTSTALSDAAASTTSTTTTAPITTTTTTLPITDIGVTNATTNVSIGVIFP